MPFKTLDDIDALNDKKVILRADLNVPLHDGVVTDATRLDAVVPTVRYLLAKGATVFIASHFGRPKGRVVADMSLRPVAHHFEKILGHPVVFIDACVGDASYAARRSVPKGGVAILENTRFHPEEENNDLDFAKALAHGADIYVNDAFSAAHRAHASTEAITHILPSYAGLLMQRELEALASALETPQKPVAALVGGAKISSKIAVLTNLVCKVDHLLIGGGMANTFFMARGLNVGRSLCEHDQAETVKHIFEQADRLGCTIHLPYDCVVAKTFEAHAPVRVASATDIADDEMALDAGPAAIEQFSDVLKTCRTLVWNGPLGAFETPPFDTATVAIARVVAALTREKTLLSIAGGGDTVSALNHAGVFDKISFVSTAGGAFLEWMEGQTLPGIAALDE